MKFAKILGLATVAVCVAQNVDAAYGKGYSAEAIYRYARHGNQYMLNRIQRNGYSLDVVDKNGNTALCTALIKRDLHTYNLLRQSGANTQHACMKKLEKSMKKVSSGGTHWTVGPSTYVGALALVGGGIAIAASDSGSSDSDSGASQPGGDVPGGDVPGGDVPGGDVPGENDKYLTPADFLTEEYTHGGFLDRVKAADAYSRFYFKNEQDGIVKNSLSRVRVGILDTGVYGAHSEFAGKDIRGHNFDYGPCQSSGQTNCWQWASEYKVRTTEGVIVLRDVTFMIRPDNSIYVANMGSPKEEYDKWASQYAPGYNWNKKHNSATSYYPEDSYGSQHGTHIAGIITANRDGNTMTGVAPDNVDLAVARWDLMSPVFDPAKALMDDGARVINFSIGTNATDKFNASHVKQYEKFVSDYFDAVDYQIAHNTVVVVAAGNESVSQPGIVNGIPLLDRFKDPLKNLFVTVVALDDAKGPNANKLAEYSNACGVAKDYCIAAPGTNITSTANPKNDFYVPMSGTSMATPVVTGSVAFLMGAYPYMSSQEIVNLMFETADDLGAPGVDEVFGHGALNLNEATKPQGDMNIPSGNSVENQGTSVAGMSLSVPSVMKSAMLAKMPKSVTAFDKYKRPYALPMNSFIRGTHGDDRNFKNDLYAFSRYQPKKKIKSDEHVSFAYAPSVMKNSPIAMGTMEVEYRDDERVSGFYYTESTTYNNDTFFEKTMTNPFLAMNSAYGLYNQYNLSDELGISMGLSTGENGLYDGSRDYNDKNFDNQVYAFDSSVSYQASKNLSLTAMSGLLYEDGAMLGLNGSGGFDVSNSQTFYAGVSVNWNPIEDLYLSGAYYQGRTSGGKMASDLMRTSDLSSDSFALDGHYKYNKTDVIGLQISSPLRVYNGRATFDVTTGRDDKTSEVYRQRFSGSLKPDAREYKLALYHTKEINEDMNLKTEFDIRLNPEHQKDAETDYRMLFGYSWTFN